MKRIRLERDELKDKLHSYKGVTSPSISARSGSGNGYEAVPSSAVEHSNTSSRGYEAIPPSAIESGKYEYQHLSPSVADSGAVSRVELSGTEPRVPVFAR